MKRLLILLCIFMASGMQACSYSRVVLEGAPDDHWCYREDPTTHVNLEAKILVLHYTVASLEKTLRIFSSDQTRVASHYTIDDDGSIYQHVPERFAAHHAGVSFWRGLSSLNRHSIGVEHVNDGYRGKEDQPDGVAVAGWDKQWYPFDPKQIAVSIRLCRDIIARNHIPAENIVGHGDVAPKRKVDPGPLFPWRVFAENGIGAWPHPETDEVLPCFEDAGRREKLNEWMLKHLILWGYQSPGGDVEERDIVRAFQMHFRQENISGEVDTESAGILDKLLRTYATRDKHACSCGMCDSQ